MEARRRAGLTLRTALLTALALGSGCARCGRPSAQDAGALEELPPSVDLRAAFFTLLPEFRGIQQLSGSATLERVTRPGSLEGLTQLLEKKGFTDISPGPPLSARFPPFSYQATARGDALEQRLSLALSASDLPKLLQSPAPLTSEHLGTLLPAPPGGRPGRETFDLELTYQAPVEHVDFLVFRLVRGLLGSGWQLDPGSPPSAWSTEQAGHVPAQLEVTLRRPRVGTEIRLQREGGAVHLGYHQPTHR